MAESESEKVVTEKIFERTHERLVHEKIKSRKSSEKVPSFAELIAQAVDKCFGPQEIDSSGSEETINVKLAPDELAVIKMLRDSKNAKEKARIEKFQVQGNMLFCVVVADERRYEGLKRRAEREAHRTENPTEKKPT